MNFKNLPANWKVVRLGRVADILTQTIDPFENPDEQFLLYSFEAFDNFKAPEIRVGGEIRSSKIILSNDCVLFARLNPRKERVWKVKINKNYINITSTEFVPFTPKINLDLEYLYWVLKTIILPRAQKNISGTTRSRERVSKEFLANLPIPLLPLPEQKRIVEILSLAEDLIKRQKETIALIDKILMAKFLEMFGDPATNPKGWEVKEFKDVVDILDSKRIPVNAEEREKRKLKAKQLYPYYGANGQVDWIDDYIFDGNYLLIAEDGGFWGAFEKTSYRVSGKFWVNNHAHIVKGEKRRSFK